MSYEVDDYLHIAYPPLLALLETKDKTVEGYGCHIHTISFQIVIFIILSIFLRMHNSFPRIKKNMMSIKPKDETLFFLCQFLKFLH